jgi:hypothetical protein
LRTDEAIGDVRSPIVIFHGNARRVAADVGQREALLPARKRRPS